jgi:hypothetical protein
MAFRLLYVIFCQLTGWLALLAGGRYVLAAVLIVAGLGLLSRRLLAARRP